MHSPIESKTKLFDCALQDHSNNPNCTFCYDLSEDIIFINWIAHSLSKHSYTCAIIWLQLTIWANDGSLYDIISMLSLWVINESVNYTSPCCHEECSLMYGYKPEVIYRLPRKDFKNFELNNTVKLNNMNFLGRFVVLPYGN